MCTMPVNMNIQIELHLADILQGHTTTEVTVWKLVFGLIFFRND